MVKKYLVIIVAILLVGCGFHLRQLQPLPPQLQRLYLHSVSPYGDLTIQLQQLLRANHIQLAASPADAAVTLHIVHDAYRRSTASKSASAKTKQYRLHYQVVYQLEDQQGTIIYGPKTIQTSRIYTVQENQILSSNTQTDVVEQEMQQAAAYQLMTQLGSKKVYQAISDYENQTGTTHTTP